jgi:hypothetical protein
MTGLFLIFLFGFVLGYFFGYLTINKDYAQKIIDIQRKELERLK